MSIFEGLSYGVATMLLIGPVFFTLLRASLEHGTRGGLVVACGIIVSDALVAVLCSSGLVLAMQHAIPPRWVAIGAGVLLLGIGARYLIMRGRGMDEHERPLGRTSLTLFASGFLVNFVNPFVFAVWIALVMRASNDPSPNGAALFLAGVLIGIFVTDIAKVLLAQRLRALISPRSLRMVYFSLGLVLLGFGMRMLVHAYGIGLGG